MKLLNILRRQQFFKRRDFGVIDDRAAVNRHMIKEFIGCACGLLAIAWYIRYIFYFLLHIYKHNIQQFTGTKKAKFAVCEAVPYALNTQIHILYRHILQENLNPKIAT